MNIRKKRLGRGAREGQLAKRRGKLGRCSTSDGVAGSRRRKTRGKWRPRAAGDSPWDGVWYALKGLLTPHNHVLLLLLGNDVGVEAVP